MQDADGSSIEAGSPDGFDCEDLRVSRDNAASKPDPDEWQVLIAVVGCRTK